MLGNRHATSTPEAALESPAKFRQAVLVETVDGPQLLADVLNDWQADDFRALDNPWSRVTGRTKSTAIKSRCYLERPRGHSKTSDLAVMVAWALAAACKPISGVAAAADRDQGRLLRDAVARLVRLNPWLNDHLDVQAHRLIGKQTGASLEIISSDAPSSYGLTPSFVVCDELTHWPSGAGGALWDSLFSSAAKVADCLLIVISNAGTDSDGWQWRVREHARTDDAWHFSRLDGPMASWLSQKVLAEQRRLLPEPVFARLWLNQWQSGGGDAIPHDDLEAAIVLNAKPTTVDHGDSYFMGVDLGVAHDASVFVIVCRENDGERVRLVDVQRWLPAPGRRVSLEEVEGAIVEACNRWGIASVALDPWQGIQMAERLRDRGITVNEVNQTGPNLQRMADAVLTGFADRKIALYHDAGLLTDLRSLTILERGTGWRLAAPRNSRGHADSATALALSLLAARRIPAKCGMFDFSADSIPSYASYWTPEQRLAFGIAGE